MTTATDTGHKIAHGKRTDYFGKAAQCPSELPVVMFDEPDANPPWDWVEDLRFWFWFAVVLSSAAGFVGWAFGPSLKRFFN